MGIDPKAYAAAMSSSAQKKNEPIGKDAETTQATLATETGQGSMATTTDKDAFDVEFNSFIGGIISSTLDRKQNWKPTVGATSGLKAVSPKVYTDVTKKQFEYEKKAENPIVSDATTVDNKKPRNVDAEIEQYYEDNKPPAREKGLGYFGELKRPDGDISTELSITVGYDGEEVEIPLLVPTLTKNEVDYLLAGNEPTDAIKDKADAHARERLKEGKSPFAELGEQMNVDDLVRDDDSVNKILAQEEEKRMDMDVLLNKANPYSIFSAKGALYDTKQNIAAYNHEQVKSFCQNTGLKINDYFGFEEMLNKELNDRKESGYEGFLSAEDYAKFENDVFAKYLDSKKVSLSNEDGKQSFFETIGNRADYIMSSMTSNTLIGKAAIGVLSGFDALLSDGTWQENYSAYINSQRENQSKYKDMSQLQEVAEMAINLGLDYGIFKGMSYVSGVVTNGAWALGGNILKSLGVAPELANIIGVQAVSNIAKGAVSMGGLLAQYDAASTFSEKLVEKPIQDFESADTQEILNSAKHGFQTGLVVGTFSGMSNLILQRVNSTLVSKGYKLNAKTGKMDIVANKSKPMKLINMGWHIGSGVIEGGIFTAMSEYNEKGNLKELDAETFIKEGLKFLVAIKAQGMGDIIKQVKGSGIGIDKDFKNPFEGKFDMRFSKYELRSLGVKSKAELVKKSQGKDFLKEKLKDSKVARVTYLKLAYGANGIQYQSTFGISRSEYVKEQGEHLVKTYDEVGNLVDVRTFGTEAEAREVETIARDFTIKNNAIKSVIGLKSDSVDKINAEYEGKPNELIKINEALRKSPEDVTAGERQALVKLTELINKVKSEEITNEKEKTDEGIEADKAVQAPEKEVIISNEKNDLLNEIDESNQIKNQSKNRKVKKIQDENINESQEKLNLLESDPLKYFENKLNEYKELSEKEPDESYWKEVVKDTEQKIQKIKEKTDKAIETVDGGEKGSEKEIEIKDKEINDTQDNAGLSGKVGKGKELIETKPIEETSGEKIEADRDVQAPEKEVKGDLAMAARTESFTTTIKMFGDRLKDGMAIERKEITNFIKEVNNFIKEVKPKLTTANYKEVLRKMQGLSKATTQEAKIDKLDEIVKFIAERDIAGLKREVKKEEIKERKIAEAQQRKEKKRLDIKQRKDRSDAKTKRKQVFKMARSMSKPFGKLSDTVKRVVGDIDITSLTPEQVKQYNDALSELTNEKLRQKPESINSFLDKINNIDFTPKEKKIQTTDEVSDYVKEIGKRDITDINSFNGAMRDMRKALRMARNIYEAGKITDKEYDQLTSKISGEFNSLTTNLKGKAEDIIEEYVKAGDKVLKEFQDMIAEGKDLPVPETNLDMIKDMILKLRSNEVKSNLSIKDAEMYNYVMDNLANGFTNGFTHDFYRRVLKAYNDYHVPDAGYSIFKSKKFKTLAANTHNNKQRFVALLSSLNSFRMSEYFGVLSNKFYKAVFSEHIEDMAAAEQWKIKVTKPVLEAMKSFKDSIRKNNRISGKREYKEQITKMAILLTEITWQNNMQKDSKDGKEYEPNDVNKPKYMKNHWDSVINKGLTVADVKDSDNYTRTLAMWKKMKQDKSLWNDDGSLNHEKVMDSFNRQGRELISEIYLYNENARPYAEESAMKHGRDLEILNFYDFMHIVIERREGKGGEDYMEDLIRSATQQPTSQAGSTFKRTMEAKAISTDLTKIINNQAKDIAQDFFVREKLLAKLRSIHNLKSGSVNFNEALQKAVVLRAARSLDKEINTGSEDFMRKFTSVTSQALLGTFTRIGKELPSGMVRNLMSQSSRSSVMTLYNRGIKEAYLDMLDDMIPNNKEYSTLSEHMDKSKTRGGKAIQDIVVFSDKKTAKPIFADEFDRSFEKQTGEKFDVGKYDKDFNYRVENYEYIEMAKADAIVRVQELYNAKTALDHATHVIFFNKNKAVDKKSFGGRTMYFLQSFSHNEAKQFIKSGKRIFSGDRNEFFRGIRDMSSIITSNVLYMHLGFAINRVLAQISSDVADGDDLDLLGDFNDGINEYYSDFIDEDNWYKSVLSSLTTLAAGKYFYTVNAALGIVMGMLKDSKTTKKETKQEIEDFGKGMYVKPISFKSSGISSAGHFHPVINELINLTRIAAIDVPNIYNDIDNGETEATEVFYVFNAILRLAYVNPVSSQLHNELKKINYATEKAKKEQEKLDKQANKDKGNKNRLDAAKEKSSRNRLD